VGDKKTNFFSSRLNVAVALSVIFLLVVFLGKLFTPKLPSINSLLSSVSKPITKVDDWQLTQVAEVDQTYSLSDYMTLVTPLNISTALAFAILYALIPMSSWYLFYRFVGFIIRRFRKNLYFGSRREVVRRLVYLFIGLVAVGVSVYLSINFSWYRYPIIAAAVLTLGGMVLAGLVTIIYIPALVVAWVINKFRKVETAGYKRRLLKTISINIASGLVVIIFLLVRLAESFFGVGVTPFESGAGYYGGIPSATSGITGLKAPQGVPFALDENIGFSTGGAKDINNFRANIENDYLPLITDVTYEGLFYDYYFDTGQARACNELFCPSYSYAVSKDPLSTEKEYYLSVGLNSGIKQSDFQRKKLNLVIVLDISGSMGSPFNKYYYDQFGNRQEIEGDEITNEPKMKVANKSVVALLDHLDEDDRFGMVVFESEAYLAKPLRDVDTTDINSIKKHILDIQDTGGTNMEAGYRLGTDLFEEYRGINKEEYENRIIFLTDAQPNIGMLHEEGLLGMTKNNAEGDIFTTFIGIGVDFNTELIEHITKIKGANYYSVHSADQFKKRMDDGFEYMVTPLVFDLALTVGSDDFDIQKVYGSPEANLATGEIMRVNTLFPSERVEGEVKGGIVLLKLEKLTDSATADLELTANYTDRVGQSFNNKKKATITDTDDDYYQNTGIRKAITLSRYANMLKIWISDERDSKQTNTVLEEPTIDTETGILIPEQVILSKWERMSVPLTVSDSYKDLLQAVKAYLEKEMQVLKDEDLKQEVQVLEKLLSN
jgi:Ca-activated chloride channel family protein